MQPLIGAAQLAFGRGEGMERFGQTAQAFLASLAPLLAFPLVGAGVLLFSGKPVVAMLAFLLTLVAQLAPAVLSHALAARWGREARWMRYATAFNWCQWALPAVAFVLLVVSQAAIGGGMAEEAAGRLVVLGLAAYGLWLHWTVARHGLDLPRGRAAWFVALVNVGTLALVMAPGLIQGALG